MAQNDILAKVSVIINAQVAELGKDLKGAQSELRSFTNGITKLAGTLGVAFGIQQVSSFALEVSKLAGEAQGVKAAFDRLPGSVRVLNELKEATGGTVSELELMKRAVQATNFGLSLGALPELFKFATLRAQQTGQAVDYLTDSIVTGVGRKSLLILDNLGISATAIRDKLNGAALASVDVATATKVIGEIAKEALGDMAGFSENASTKVQRLNASWENYKVVIGEAANGTGVLGGAIDAATDSLDVFSNKDLSFLQKLSFFVGGAAVASGLQAEAIVAGVKKVTEQQKKQEQIVREVDRAYKEFNGNLDAYSKVITTHIYKDELLIEFKKRITDALKKEEEGLETIANLTAKLTSLQEEQSVTIAGPLLSSINREIEATKEKIKVLQELGKVEALSRASTSTSPLQTEVKPFDLSSAFSEKAPTTLADSLLAEMKRIGDGYFILRQNKELEAEASIIANQRIIDSQIMVAQNAQTMGNIIGSAFGSVISGQEDMRTAMLKATSDIVSTLLDRAIAGMLSASATSGAPPPIALALAAAGAAAIKGLFAKLIGGGRGGGGSTSLSSSATRSSTNLTKTAQNSTSPIPSFQIKGQDLWVVFNNFAKANKYTTAGG